jgi:hypothetical protein
MMREIERFQVRNDEGAEHTVIILAQSVDLSSHDGYASTQGLKQLTTENGDAVRRTKDPEVFQIDGMAYRRVRDA